MTFLKIPHVPYFVPEFRLLQPSKCGVNRAVLAEKLAPFRYKNAILDNLYMVLGCKLVIWCRKIVVDAENAENSKSRSNTPAEVIGSLRKSGIATY